MCPSRTIGRRAPTPLPGAPAQDERDWAASCLFVRKGYRGQGLTAALLFGGLGFAREGGARLVEAAPMERVPPCRLRGIRKAETRPPIDAVRILSACAWGNAVK